MTRRDSILEAVRGALAGRQDIDHPKLRFVTVTVRLNPRSPHLPAMVKVDLTTEDDDLPGRSEMTGKRISA